MANKTLEYGTNGRALGSTGTETGTEMIVKAYEDSVVSIVANWGVDGASVTKEITLTSQGTIEGVTSVTWVSGYVIVYK